MAKRALVIGSQTHGLTGVENDASKVAALLEQRGFVVDVRTESQATRAGILEGYDRLISSVAEGEAAVVYYAGHGHFTLSSNPASPDRLQGIVPTDFDESTGDDYRGITSWELSIKQAQLTRRTRNVTVILDCCYSAQMSRDGAARDAVPRALPHPLYTDLAAYFEKLKKIYGVAVDAVEPLGNPDAVRLVACAQSEFAMEYANARGQRTGAFTEALLELLTEIGDAPVSWAVLGQAIRERVLRRFPAQRPDVEGPVDRQLFSLVQLPERNAVAIAERSGEYQIDAGYIHGVNKGDKYNVVSFRAQDRPMAEAIVTSTGATTGSVDVRWSSSERKLPDDAIAILRARAAVTQPVTVIAPDDQRSGIAEQVAQARTLHVANSDEKDASVATLRVANNQLTIEDAYGPLFPAAPYPASLAGAVRNLANLGTARTLRALEGENGIFARELAIEWGVVEDGKRRKLDDHGYALGLGDRIYCSVKNTTKRRLHVHIFNIGLRSRVTLLTGWSPSGIALNPGEETLLGEAFDGSLVGLELSWPDGLPRNSLPRIDTLLIIATVNPANLSGLQSIEVAMRGSPDSKGSALEKLLEQIQTGGTREIGGPTQIDGHFAKQLTYLLHPREGKLASPEPLVDEGARGTSPTAAAWRTPAATRPRRIAIWLGAMEIANTHAWFATDIRVDALIATRPSEGEPGHRAHTMRCRRVRSGQRVLEDTPLYDGPVRDFVDIMLWVSRDRAQSESLSELLASRASHPEVEDAVAALKASAGVDAPWISAIGASAVLARVAYDALQAVSGSAIGLYRTSFLVSEDYGIGQHPKQGLYRAQAIPRSGRCAGPSRMRPGFTAGCATRPAAASIPHTPSS